MSRTSPAGRKYLQRFAPAMAAYAVLIVAVKAWMNTPHPPTGVLLYGAALAPALPLLGVIWAMGRYIVEETDEYLRALQVQSMLWGIGVTLAVATVWGFLESFANAPHAPAYFPVFVFCAVMAVVQITRRITERLQERE